MAELGALESLSDPLVDPLLALLKDGVNADILALTTAAAAEDARAAVLVTSRRPFVLSTEGEGVLPALHCYRVRARVQQFSAVHVDHINTLQLQYVTPACAVDVLDARWAVLDRVWRSILVTLKRGKHAAHASGADVLCDAGVVRVDYASALKSEAFIGGEGATPFPGFIAQVDVTWRDLAREDTSALSPVYSFLANIFVDTDGDTSGTPDVRALADVHVQMIDDDGDLMTDDEGSEMGV